MECTAQSLFGELTKIASAETDVHADNDELLNEIERAVNTGRSVRARGLIADAYRRGFLPEQERRGLAEISYELPLLRQTA